MKVKDAKAGDLIQIIGSSVTGPLLGCEVYRVARHQPVKNKVKASCQHGDYVLLHPDNECQVFKPVR